MFLVNVHLQMIEGELRGHIWSVIKNIIKDILYFIQFSTKHPLFNMQL